MAHDRASCLALHSVRSVRDRCVLPRIEPRTDPYGSSRARGCPALAAGFACVHPLRPRLAAGSRKSPPLESRIAKLTEEQRMTSKPTHVPAVDVARTAIGANRPIHWLDLKRFLGNWYEIARLPTRFERDCGDSATATYTRNPDGTIAVRNTCRTLDGSFDEANGIARPTEVAGALEVSFAPRWMSWLPFAWAHYWVIDLDPSVPLGPRRRPLAPLPVDARSQTADGAFAVSPPQAVRRQQGLSGRSPDRAGRGDLKLSGGLLGSSPLDMQAFACIFFLRDDALA